MSSYPDDDMPIQSRGGYQLDFDNLDAINPFQGSNTMALSPARPVVKSPPAHQSEPQLTEPENILEEPTKIDSALDETLPFTPSVENSLVDRSTDISSTESSVVTVMKVPAVEELDSCTVTPDEKQPAEISPHFDEDKVSGSFLEDAPLPAKGSYNLDFENLDVINPFQTGGSKLQNSPVLGRKLPDSNPPVEETQREDSKPTNVDVPQVALEVPVQAEVKPVAAVAPISTDAAKVSATDSTSQPSDAPTKEGPVKLEFNFDGDGEVKRKPPPKKFGKRPSGVTSKTGKPTSDIEPPKETPVKSDENDVADVPPPKGCYSFDFDKFDDPNFDLFGTKAKMTNSPKGSKKSSPEVSVPEHTDKPAEKEAVSPGWYVNLFSNIYLQ